VKIYWTLKSIPELADLSQRERGRRWRSVYKSALWHRETWCGMALCAGCAGAGAYLFGMVGGTLMAALGGFLYGQIVTYVALKYYRHRLRGEAG